MTQDELLDIITAVVRELDCRELQQWLTTIKLNRDPRKLPHFQEFEDMFTESNGRWPTVHLLTQMAFNDLAQVKLDAECR